MINHDAMRAIVYALSQSKAVFVASKVTAAIDTE